MCRLRVTSLCSYGVQEAATIFPDLTRSAGPLAAPDADDPLAAPASSSITPVSSSFLPTCSVNADPFAIKR